MSSIACITHSGHVIRLVGHSMEKAHNETDLIAPIDTNATTVAPGVIIPVIAEKIQIDKKIIDTAKVTISKQVTEHQESINIPLLSEQYEVVRVPVHQTVVTPPAAMRQEGETTIMTVVKEILVVEKHYEIVEELRITKRVSQQIESQNITLRAEEISVVRMAMQTADNNK